MAFESLHFTFMAKNTGLFWGNYILKVTNKEACKDKEI